MYSPWQIIFECKRPDTGAQEVYDELFHAALSHKFKEKKDWVAVQVTPKVLTDAIFDLNDHHNVLLNGKEIGGQKVKELFITTIFLKLIENRFANGSSIFVALPDEIGSCDTALVVTNPEEKQYPLEKKQLKVPKPTAHLLFQIKEYYDHEKFDPQKPLELTPINTHELNKLSGTYTEDILIFMRNFSTFESAMMRDFFANHQNCFLISVPDAIEHVPEDSLDGKMVPLLLDNTKHNYIVTMPNDKFGVVSFDPPSFLVSDEKMKRIFGLR